MKLKIKTQSNIPSIKYVGKSQGKAVIFFEYSEEDLKRESISLNECFYNSIIKTLCSIGLPSRVKEVKYGIYSEESMDDLRFVIAVYTTFLYKKWSKQNEEMLKDETFERIFHADNILWECAKHIAIQD